jgi:hypothetical protein
MKTPKCFDSDEQYARWHIAAVDSVRGKLVKRWLICEDCTPEYKARMLDVGRCENPGYVVTLQNDNNSTS